jgi:hypothetical protein
MQSVCSSAATIQARLNRPEVRLSEVEAELSADVSFVGLPEVRLSEVEAKLSADVSFAGLHGGEERMDGALVPASLLAYNSML